MSFDGRRREAVDFGAIAASGSDDDAVVSDAIVELVGSGFVVSKIVQD
jgi:hypothetical protein